MSSTRILIAIVGLPGSGKTIAADFFRSHEFEVLRFGDQTDIGLKELGLPINETNERMYRERIRKELGMAAMAIKIEPRIQAAYQKHSKLVLDGMRSLAEYTYLKEKFPYMTVLCVYAPPGIRHERLASRTIRPLGSEESVKRDFAELTALDSGGPIALADTVIQNTGTVEELTEKLTSYVTSLS